MTALAGLTGLALSKKMQHSGGFDSSGGFGGHGVFSQGGYPPLQLHNPFSVILIS